MAALRLDEGQVQADMRTHLIHRPRKDITSFLLSHLILEGAAAASLVQRNSVPSTQMRCMITAKRRASATTSLNAFDGPRAGADQAVSGSMPGPIEHVRACRLRAPDEAEK